MGTRDEKTEGTARMSCYPGPALNALHQQHRRSQGAALGPSSGGSISGGSHEAFLLPDLTNLALLSVQELLSLTFYVHLELPRRELQKNQPEMRHLISTSVPKEGCRVCVLD